MGCTNVDELNLKEAFIKGGTAGTFTLTGITADDHLKSVWKIEFGTDGAIGTVADLSSEFTYSAANTITNASGTNSTGAVLAVHWYDKDDT